jgi:membrane protease YdiL (CAAX protease family)
MSISIATNPASPSTGPRWPLGSTGAVLLAFGLILAHGAVLFGAGGLLARALHLGGKTIYAASPASFAMLIIVASLEVGVVFGLLMRGVARLGLREVGWRQPSLGDLGLGALGFAACACVFVAMLAVLFKNPGAGWAHVVRTVSSFTVAQRVFFALMGALAAFGEETIFRGILQPTLQTKLGRWGGLTLTALIFGAYHLKFAPVVLLGKVAVGLVLGGLREKTGRLWAPAVAHALIWAVLGTT